MAVNCAPGSAHPFRQYNHKLVMDLPGDWECTQQSSGRFLATWVDPAMRFEINTVTLVHQPLPDQYTLTEYVNSTVANESKLLWQYQLLSKELVEHDYGPYYRLIFNWRSSWEQQYFVMQMIICRYPDVYVLTGTAPASASEYYQPLFQAIFDSFAFVN